MTAADRDAPETHWTGPQRFDDFEVLRPLGHGGMGQVFLGNDVVLERPVALKFTMADDPSPAVRARFLREARSIARLSHPNVVGIFRVGEVQGRPYIAYEFVAGHTLDRLRAPMPWPRVARIALGMARGLAAAHGAGVLHRDVKPNNVMLTEAGEVKLLDFGLARIDEGAAAPDARAPVAPAGSVDPVAKTYPGSASQHASTGEVRLTHAGAVMGTPLYMPPEIWRREEATARSDLYAFGLVLYELLTGALPHGGRGRTLNIDEVMHLDAAPVASRCPDALPSLAALVDQCVRRAPDERPASADAVARALERICAVFLPARHAHASLREDGDAELVAASLDRVLARGDALTVRLYERLFEARPELRALFPVDLDGQREKLRHALQLSAEALSDHERLLPVLLDLGRRHAHLRLDLGDYASVGDALLASLAELDAAWSPDVDSAWRRAWAFLINAMRRGESSSTPRPPTETRSGSRVDGDAARPPSGPSSVPPPATRYAYLGDHGVAYQVFGRAAPDLLLHLGRVSHLDYGWRQPRMAAFLRGLGATSRVVVFDRRGTGLSERIADALRMQQRVEDVLAVLDAAGSQRAVIFGVSEGAMAALLFAAMFPERARGVVCFNAAARLLKTEGYPGGLDPEFLDAACERIKRHWGEGIFVEAEAPSLVGDGEFAAWFGEYLRSASTPGHVVAQLRLNALYDARVVLPFVRVPALVMHRRDNRLAPASGGRYIADHLADARFVELAGADHLPFAGDLGPIMRAVEDFSRDPRLDAPAPLPLRTLALVSADRDDAPLLRLADDRFAAVGAVAVALDDPRARLYASPWFATMADAATQLTALSGATAQGLRAAVHADLVDVARAAEAPVTAALRAAASQLAPGSCAASGLIAALCVATSVAFGEPVAGAAPFVYARRASQTF